MKVSFLDVITETGFGLVFLLLFLFFFFFFFLFFFFSFLFFSRMPCADDSQRRGDYDSPPDLVAQGVMALISKVRLTGNSTRMAFW